MRPWDENHPNMDDCNRDRGVTSHRASGAGSKHPKLPDPTPHCGNLAAPPSLPHIFLGKVAEPPCLKSILSRPAYASFHHLLIDRSFPSFSTPSSLRLHQSSRQPASTQLRLLRGGNRISFILHSRFTLSPLNFTAP